MRLVEITISDQKEAILKRVGEEVILNDAHYKWRHGILQKDPREHDTYQLKLISEKFYLTLNYNNLNSLLEVSPI